MVGKYQNKFRSSLLGLAIGDALGMPCEDYSQSELSEKFGKITDYLDPPEGQFNYGKLKAGMFTDDTEQAIVLTESLIVNKGLDVNHFAIKLLGEYGKNVVEHPELDRWIGSTFKRAVRNYIFSMPPDKCGVKAESCGSAMRVAPIGLFYMNKNLNDVSEMAAESSRVTHIGAETTAAAQAVALYVNLALVDITPGIIADMVVKKLEKESRTIAEGIKRAYRLRDEKPEKAVEILGESQLAREIVPTAIYSFNHSPKNFGGAVLTSVNMGGDTDSRAAITGAISGAFNRFHDIPNQWIENLENNDRLIGLADKLWETRLLMLREK